MWSPNVFEYARKSLEKISATLRKAFPDRIVSITAFGSRVRGDHTGESDFDVLVVVENRSPELEDRILSVFVEEEMRSGVSFDPLIKSLESFELEKRYGTAFYENITSEGVRM